MTGGLLFQRFAEQLKREIAAERYPVGCILPSISKFQEQSGLSRNTVVSALRLLSNEGLIERVGAARYGYTVIKKGKSPDNLDFNKESAAIALVFPFSYNNYIGSQLLQAIESVLSGSAIKLFIRNHENSPEREKEILEGFLNQHRESIDGIILMTSDSYGNPNRLLIEKLAEQVPTVLLDRYIFGLDIPFAGLNNRRAGRDAAEKLIRQGHTHLGFISGFERLSSTIDRLEGFREAARRSGIAINEDEIYLKTDEINVLDESDEFHNRLRRSLNTGENGPTAYFCGDDKSAMVLHRILDEKAIKVPEDVSIIGSNDDGFVRAASNYRISSYRYPFATIADEAVRILSKERMDHIKLNINVEVSAEFMDRGTVAPKSRN